MAVGSGVPLSGPGPPQNSRSHVLSVRNRKSQAQSSRLEVPAAFIRALFDRHSRPERGRTLQTSNPKPFDTVADLLRQCISALVLESSDRESSFNCDAVANDFREGKNVFQRPPNGRRACDQSLFPSKISSGRLEVESTRFGIEKQSPHFVTGDDRPGSIANFLPEQLKKAANPGDDSSISDLSTLKRIYGCREVKFQWLKTGNLDDAIGNGYLGVIPSSSIREDEVLSFPGKPKAHQNSHTDSCAGLKTPMGCLEGASRRPSRGWEVVKAGMEKVLGRSIVPAQETKSSIISPKSVAPVAETAGNIGNSTNSGLEASNRGCLSSVLVTNAGGREAGLQGASTPVDFSNRAEDCNKQGPNRSLLSQRMGDNAVAGALAGTFVSLCLHPVDTVKTVIQAQSFGQRSVVHNLVAIISKRGVSGLYRGLGSNLASSAPISAIYTFTYESVKASLLPHLPKEYYALAHCAAGGCASIATSVVYTPSECVKQRMQVGSLYRNSWLAFLGTLRNGGLSVLYSGWGAVLCRNVPQSIIKFYTYEGLKHYALNWHPVGTSPNTWQTLAFGGLAGSTAALFTTPFDVIKTRLQTQVPGSAMYQKGVLQAFQHIAASEGIGGLYRGLIPRLVIYVSQGAFFFASYEFFKQVLAVNVRKLSFNTAHSHSQGTIRQVDVVEST